ncbi:hypothetical protein MAR_029828, partial [Mya arenaria]
VGGGPGQIPDRIVNRLRRKGGDKTKIGFPHNLQMTRSDRKLLARHIREEALEDRRLSACRTHLHADAFRRRLVLAAEEEAQPQPPMDSATSARMRQLEIVKARAAERRAKAREMNPRIKNTEESLRRAH